MSTNEGGYWAWKVLKGMRGEEGELPLGLRGVVYVWTESGRVVVYRRVGVEMARGSLCRRSFSKFGVGKLSVRKAGV